MQRFSEPGRRALIELKARPTSYFVPYGFWFVGFSEMFSELARVRTASSVRPSFNPITLVGVFSDARSRSCLTSCLVQAFPVFLVYFGTITTSFRSRAAAIRGLFGKVMPYWPKGNVSMHF